MVPAAEDAQLLTLNDARLTVSAMERFLSTNRTEAHCFVAAPRLVLGADVGTVRAGPKSTRTGWHPRQKALNLVSKFAALSSIPYSHS